jgi:hypothetical protein
MLSSEGEEIGIWYMFVKLEVYNHDVIWIPFYSLERMNLSLELFTVIFWFDYFHIVKFMFGIRLTSFLFFFFYIYFLLSLFIYFIFIFLKRGEGGILLSYLY